MVTSIAQILEPHVQDLGGFQVRRSLPHGTRSMVGPFIFFDHMGPAVFPPGQGMDVRPHPHINLATVTYLFEGAILHRDSVGSVQEIQPGAVNWMTAGRGITHSERTPERDRQQSSHLHGIQTWIALPEANEEVEPSFQHYPASEIPTCQLDGVTITVVAGQFFGHVSPVKAFSPILYLDAVFSKKGQFTVPADYSERAVYTVTSGLSIDGEPLAQYQMAILQPGSEVTIASSDPARCVVVGGPVGDRIKWWNFVSSRPERVEQAKQDWKAGRFPPVPAESEFIPLPAEV
ncbi:MULTISPECIES: pirin family protein [unclassified Leptolyngbya]|uniref:pirin family protein n=1 Tax=unclassified Leptolyngbya TaxID=2650499 RepID=UPI001685FA0F|nr:MULTISPECIES: pirin family protein [unclassified Leptolyngbya]MBD1911771.1 pirin family protein [Leptolyngbya sp. FACHB-8]MBD2153339.1 pirin family protein [Leptolyngbya sp. FACHB-16]